MSNIASDTRDIAKRIPEWEWPEGTISMDEIPDTECLRVHALRLADAFDEVQQDNAKIARKLRSERDRYRDALESVVDLLSGVDKEDLSNRNLTVIHAAHIGAIEALKVGKEGE